MKRYSLLATGSALAFSILLAAAATTTAQNANSAADSSRAAENRQRQSQADRNRQRLTGRTSPGQLDAKTSGANLRASQIIGMNIYNPNEESVGEVNDIVLDANTGRVRYAAVTYGGFLGIGDKMFAVPWEAFQCKQDEDDPDDYHLVLNVTQRQLEGAKGFSQDNWPNFADRSFTDEVDRRYGVQRRDRIGRVGVDANRDGVDVDVDRRGRNDQ